MAEPADEVDRAGIPAFRQSSALHPVRQLIFGSFARSGELRGVMAGFRFSGAVRG
jgi:hypothetical protein